MDPGFDFNNFARDEALQSQISELMDAIQEQGDPALRERFANLRRRHKIENEEDPPPDFHFNTTALTYEDVARHCAQNNLNLRRLVFVQGDRFYVSRNYVLGENQVWDQIASPSSVDIQQESAQLAFLDPNKIIVDWPLTLLNLNNMILHKPYSQAMLRNCLLRYVNHYESAQTEYLRNKTCDEIANFLLCLSTRIDRKAYHKSRLLSAVRRPEETLSAAVHKVRNIAESIYVNVPDPDAAAVQPVVPGGPQPAAAGEPAGPAQAPPAADAPVPEINPLVNRILINAIISFCRDDIAVPLNKMILQDSSLSRLKDYMYYLRIAMKAEMRQNAFPTVPLKYSRKLPEPYKGLASLNSASIPHIPDGNDKLNHYLNCGNVGIARRNDHAHQNVPVYLNAPVYQNTPAHQNVPIYLNAPVHQNAPAHHNAPFYQNDPAYQNAPVYLNDPAHQNAPTHQNDPAVSALPSFQVVPALIPAVLNGPVYPPYHSVHDRTLPVPRNEDRSLDERESHKANIYSEVLSMMIQNLIPNISSSIPDRGRSRDSSRNRFRNNSGDKQGRQPRRDSSWNRSGYNLANDPSIRLSTERGSTPDRRDISRDRSYESKRMQDQENATTKAYPNMRKGFNCSSSYNPAANKVCTKCPFNSGHHEFDCKKYSRYNFNRCSLCDRYHHYSSDCQEVFKYPPKHADTNSVYSSQKDPN